MPFVYECLELDEATSEHANERFRDRFEKSLAPHELEELIRRYNAVDELSHLYSSAAVLLLDVRRKSFFQNGQSDASKSYGDIIFAIIRDGVIKTIFRRGSRQPVEYFYDKSRGNTRYLLYIDDALKLHKFPKHEASDTFGKFVGKNAEKPLPNFNHIYKHKKSTTDETPKTETPGDETPKTNAPQS